MSERMFKCPKCGGAVPASSCKRIKQRYYHPKCYEEKIKEDLAKEEAKKEKVKKKEIKPQAKCSIEIPEAVPESEAKERQHFFNKVKQITGNKNLSARTYALADKYKKDFKDFSWNGMEKTLIYVYELNDGAIQDEIIGIIPWKYTEANQFFESLEELKPTEQNLKDLYKRKKVKIRPKHDEKPDIDISQIGV